MAKTREARARHITSHHNWPRVSSPINDNYCVNASVYAGLLARSKETINVYQSPETLSLSRKIIETQTQQNLSVNSSVVTLTHIVIGQLQKKDVSPVVANCYQKLKYVKDFSCVAQLSFAKPVINVPTVVLDLPVGARLHKFWETWEALGVGLKVVKILKEGYTLPFQIWPNLIRSLAIMSCYWQSPQEPLPVGGITSAYEKNAVELVKN